MRPCWFMHNTDKYYMFQQFYQYLLLKQHLISIIYIITVGIATPYAERPADQLPLSSKANPEQQRWKNSWHWMKERNLETLLLFDKIQPQRSWGATLTQDDRKKTAKSETAVGLNEAEKWTFELNEVSLCLWLPAPSVIFAPLSFAATTNGNTPVHISVCCLLEAFCNWSAVLNPLILMEMWVFSTFNLNSLLRWTTIPIRHFGWFGHTREGNRFFFLHFFILNLKMSLLNKSVLPFS